MYKRKRVLHNGQQPGSSVNSLIDQSEFEAIKMQSFCRAPAVIIISFVLKMAVIILKQFFLDITVELSKKQKKRRKWHFLYAHAFMCSAAFCKTFG